MEIKYEFVEDDKIVEVDNEEDFILLSTFKKSNDNLNGRQVLTRIRAVRDIKNDKGEILVRTGELGGYIEKEENLSQKDSCWVYDDSKVLGYVRILDDTIVKNNSVIDAYDITFISGKSIIDHCEISNEISIVNSELKNIVIYGVTEINNSKIFLPENDSIFDIEGEKIDNDHFITKVKINDDSDLFLFYDEGNKKIYVSINDIKQNYNLSCELSNLYKELNRIFGNNNLLKKKYKKLIKKAKDELKTKIKIYDIIEI